jgi:DNA modification methylase
VGAFNVTGLVQADAVELPLADDSVDLVVTSPPYFALRSYQDDGEHYDGQIGSEATPAEFLDALWAVTRECVRVLKPSGSLWVNLGDKYAGSGGHNNAGVGGTGRGPTTYTKASGHARPKSLLGLPWRYALGCIDDLGLILRAEVVWSKPNGLPESVTDRVRRSHEQWFHFTLEPRYFSAIDEIREPYTAAPAKAQPSKAFAAGATRNPALCPDHDLEHNPLGKLPGSVWSVPSEPLKVPDDLGVDHFAAFPQEWPRRLILGWCPAEVCTACGQGRAPVTELDADYAAYREATGDWNASARAPGGYDQKANRRVDAAAPQTWAGTITGRACACPDTTAPSTPGVVLDPFTGTGTVPMVARALGRTGIGVDLSADYLRLARWRVFQSGHASKTVARTNGERQGLLL